MTQVILWAGGLGLFGADRVPLVQVVDNITPKFLQFLREDPRRLQQLTPEQFERFTVSDWTGWDMQSR
jgi:hypothetical protein